MTKEYYGTKLITAWPQEKDGAPGYAVKYADGYISWSPKETFEAAYQPMDQLSFGHALVAMKAGKRVARAGWNGKGMWLTRVTNWSAGFGVDLPEDFRCLPWIAMKTADNGMVPWLASQTDIEADDWCVIG